MNRRIALELGGRVFQIEEPALLKIEAYIAALKQSFGHEADGEEIIADIESRMSELLAHKTDNMSRPVHVADAEEVLQVMGAPSDIGGESPVTAPMPGQKRLFRHPDDQVVAGVCSGLGAYFGVDPLWFRLAFALAVFTFGTGILLYVLLIVIVPVATSPAERLMMHGEAVTLQNMERRLKDEGAKVRNNVERSLRTPAGKGLRRIARGIRRLFHFATWGIAFACFGVGLFLSILWSAESVIIDIAGLEFRGLGAMQALFRSTTEAIVAGQLIIIVLCVPILYLFMNALFKSVKKRTSGMLRLVYSGLIFLATGGLVVLFLLTGSSYRAKAAHTRSMVYSAPDTLFVHSNHMNTLEYPDLFVLDSTRQEKGMFLHQSGLSTTTSTDSMLKIETTTWSRGRDEAVALQLAEALPPAFSYTTRHLYLNNNLHLKPGTPFRGQQHFVRITVPRNTVIVMDPASRSMQHSDLEEWRSHWEKEEH